MGLSFSREIVLFHSSFYLYSNVFKSSLYYEAMKIEMSLYIVFYLYTSHIVILSL